MTDVSCADWLVIDVLIDVLEFATEVSWSVGRPALPPELKVSIPPS